MPDVEPIPLAQLTTLRTGGVPARMIDAHTADELVDALTEVWSDGDDWLVLGGGSNLFAGDEPFDGTVVRVLTQGIERMPSPRPGFVRLRVQAGHDWDALVAYAVEHGLAGIEAMSGIPGTVGAAPVQNIGAYGQEIVQTLVEVELLDEGALEPVTVPAAELGLGFRTSVLKHHYGSVPLRSAVILSVTLELAEVGHAERPIAGAQLRTALGLAPGRDGLGVVDPRSRARDPASQGHGARRRRPRHLQRRIVLPERRRLGILRADASRRVPPVARRPRSRPRARHAARRAGTASSRRPRASSPTSRSAPAG